VRQQATQLGRRRADVHGGLVLLPASASVPACPRYYPLPSTAKQCSRSGSTTRGGKMPARRQVSPPVTTTRQKRMWQRRKASRSVSGFGEIGRLSSAGNEASLAGPGAGENRPEE